MKIRVVNKGKLIRSVVVVLMLMLGLSTIMGKGTLSHGEEKHKTIYTAEGDTIWNIAKQEKEMNLYYQEIEIRDIVEDILETNNKTNSSIKIGESLEIPYL